MSRTTCISWDNPDLEKHPFGTMQFLPNGLIFLIVYALEKF
jgi:ureidoglycolate hydrolase